MTALGLMVVRPAVGQTAPSLAYSRSSNRSSPQPLAGAQLTGTVYVFVSPTNASLGPVRFFLDGILKRTENNPPYDFAGGSASANPFNLDALAVGSYTIRAEWSGGFVSATFQVGPSSTTTTSTTTTTTQPTSTTTTQPPTTTTTGPPTSGWSLTFSGTKWLIDGVPVNPGTAIEGLARNIRLVQAIADFTDGAPNWDAEANTDAFIAALPTFKGYGINAITICLQGGNPGGTSRWGTNYDSSTFNPNGSMRPAFTDRLKRVLDAMTDLGIVPIVGIFYFRQEQILTDEAAVKTAINNSIAFLAPWREQIVVEVMNEANNGQVIHRILLPDYIKEPIKMFRDAGYHCTFTLMGGGIPTVAQAGTSDLILLHGNKRTAAQITSDTNMTKSRFPNKPVVYNEDGAQDDSYTTAAYIANLHAAFEAGAGWGYSDGPAFQTVGPVGTTRRTLTWEPSTDRSRAVLAEMRDLT